MAQIITVIGLVPGAGATFISTNIAAYMASEGANALLIDLGARGVLGALHIMEAARESVHPTLETWREFSNPGESLLRTSYGLAVLPGRPIDAEKRESPPSQVGEVLDHFAPGFDVVVIDAGGDLYLPHVGQCIEKAGLCLVVAEPSQRCFQAIPENKRVELAANQNLRLIVNRISKGSYYHPRDITRWFGVADYIAVPEDLKINDATKKRLPLVLYGRGKACAILRQIAEYGPNAVVKRVSPAAAGESAALVRGVRPANMPANKEQSIEPKSGIFGFVWRMFTRKMFIRNGQGMDTKEAIPVETTSEVLSKIVKPPVRLVTPPTGAWIETPLIQGTIRAVQQSPGNPSSVTDKAAGIETTLDGLLRNSGAQFAAFLTPTGEAYYKVQYMLGSFSHIFLEEEVWVDTDMTQKQVLNNTGSKCPLFRLTKHSVVLPLNGGLVIMGLDGKLPKHFLKRLGGCG
jgi:MinD-like ATPase involved in chromosome partitioning or flagellar assembly